MLQPRAIARYILNDLQLWRGIIAVICTYGYWVRACNWKRTNYIDIIATFESAWSVWSVWSAVRRLGVELRVAFHVRPGRASLSRIFLLQYPSEPRKPHRVPVGIARSATVSWTQSIGERLENVAKRNEIEQNEARENEWTCRHGVARRRTTKERANERRRRAAILHMFKIERSRRSRSLLLSYYKAP